MKIIFDLDYTLLDTGRFKKKLADIFARENFYADYKKYFKDRSINFDSAKYLAILKDENKINSRREKELRLDLKELFGRLDDYLFPETFEILSHFKNSGAELILLTFGDKLWQEEKVNNLSIKKNFSKIIFEEKNKRGSEYLRSLSSDSEEILIINDNAREAKEMIEIIGEQAKAFLISGPYAENIKHDWPVHRLDELNKLKT